MTNRDALILLTSQLSVGHQHRPFTATQISQIINKLTPKNLTLKDLANQQALQLAHIFYDRTLETCNEKERDFLNQIVMLFQREGSMAFAMLELNRWGIKILTREDEQYPSEFLTHLGDKAPPLFYYAGHLGLLKGKYIGFTGSRLKKLQGEDESITKTWANHAIKLGFGIVSGGATGVDSFATQVAIAQGKPFIECLSDSMVRRLQINAISRALQDEHGLLISETIPDAPFNVGMAMARNKYIFLLAHKVIAVKAEYSIKDGKKTGGTWNGAIENLKSNYTRLFVINNPKSVGNQELLKLGALPLPMIPSSDETFDQPNSKTINPPKSESPDLLPDAKLLDILTNKDFYTELKLTVKERELIQGSLKEIVSFKSIQQFQALLPEKLFTKLIKKASKVNFIQQTLI